MNDFTVIAAWMCGVCVSADWELNRRRSWGQRISWIAPFLRVVRGAAASPVSSGGRVSTMVRHSLQYVQCAYRLHAVDLRISSLLLSAQPAFYWLICLITWCFLFFILQGCLSAAEGGLATTVWENMVIISTEAEECLAGTSSTPALLLQELQCSTQEACRG